MEFHFNFIAIAFYGLRLFGRKPKAGSIKWRIYGKTGTGSKIIMVIYVLSHKQFYFGWYYKHKKIFLTFYSVNNKKEN